jgi:hypothetical protein
MKMAVFWVVAPCSLVEVYQRFRGPCCLHHQGDEYPSIFVLTAVRTSNPTKSLYGYRKLHEPGQLSHYSDWLQTGRLVFDSK